MVRRLRFLKNTIKFPANMDDPSTLTERIIKGSSIVILLAILTTPIGYLLRILYSQTLSIEMYGLFYAVLAMFNTIAVYNDLGFGYSVSYLIPKYLKKKNYQLCWIIYKYDQLIEVGTSVLLSCILIIAAPWLAENYFKMPQAVNLIYIFCIYLIANSFLSALNKFFAGLQQEKYYSSMQLVRLFFTLIFSLMFWFFDKSDILFYATSWAAAYIITSALYNYSLYKKNPYIVKSALLWDRKLFKLMYSYALPTLVTTSIYSFILFVDTFFLTLFRGVTEVGIYNVVLPIVSISNIFLSPINAFIYPLISHLMEGEKEKLSILLNSILKIIPFLGLYFGLFIFLFPSAPVKLLFGQKWTGLVEMPLKILAFGFIAASLSSYLTTIVSGMGKVNERLKASAVIAFFSIALNAIFIYKFGVTGLVWANSIVYIISVYLFGKIVQSAIPFKYPVWYYLKLSLFSLLIYTVTRYFHLTPSGWVDFILYGVIYTGIVSLLALYLKIVDQDIIRLIVKKS